MTNNFTRSVVHSHTVENEKTFIIYFFLSLYLSTCKLIMESKYLVYHDVMLKWMYVMRRMWEKKNKEEKKKEQTFYKFQGYISLMLLSPMNENVLYFERRRIIGRVWWWSGKVIDVHIHRKGDQSCFKNFFELENVIFSHRLKSDRKKFSICFTLTPINVFLNSSRDQKVLMLYLLYIYLLCILVSSLFSILYICSNRHNIIDL